MIEDSLGKSQARRSTESGQVLAPGYAGWQDPPHEAAPIAPGEPTPGNESAIATTTTDTRRRGTYGGDSTVAAPGDDTALPQARRRSAAQARPGDDARRRPANQRKGTITAVSLRDIRSVTERSRLWYERRVGHLRADLRVKVGYQTEREAQRMARKAHAVYACLVCGLYHVGARRPRGTAAAAAAAKAGNA